MTATTTKFNDYQRYNVKNLSQKRSLSSSIEENHRRFYNQQNIDELLRKCRTSQRGIACNPQVSKKCQKILIFTNLKNLINFFGIDK